MGHSRLECTHLANKLYVFPPIASSVFRGIVTVDLDLVATHRMLIDSSADLRRQA